jgi:hypothetical protein
MGKTRRLVRKGKKSLRNKKGRKTLRKGIRKTMRKSMRRRRSKKMRGGNDEISLMTNNELDTLASIFYQSDYKIHATYIEKYKNKFCELKEKFDERLVILKTEENKNETLISKYRIAITMIKKICEEEEGLYGDDPNEHARKQSRLSEYSP